MKVTNLSLGTIIGLVATAAGVLYAANMGVKLHYDLPAQGTTLPEGGPSMSGQSGLCLPYIPMDSLVDAAGLFDHINDVAGSQATVQVGRFLRESDELQAYTGASTDLPNNFALSAAEGYRVQVRSDVGYKIVGSHDPGAIVTLYPQGTDPVSASGQSEYCPPFHTTAQTASDLRDEIDEFAGSSVVKSISRFVRSSDSLQTYTSIPPCSAGCNDFAIVPGESYRVQVTGTTPITFAPSHY